VVNLTKKISPSVTTRKKQVPRGGGFSENGTTAHGQQKDAERGGSLFTREKKIIGVSRRGDLPGERAARKTGRASGEIDE